MTRILLLTLFLALPSLGQEEKNEVPKNNQEAAQSTKNSDPQPKPELPAVIETERTILDTNIRSKVGESPSNKESNRNPVDTVIESDLRAQWTMAIAAVIITIITLIATTISFYGVRLIKATLIANKELLRHSKDAVHVTREIGEAQVRAYIQIRLDDIKFPNSKTIVEFNFSCLNHGQSPLQNITANILFRFTEEVLGDFSIEIGDVSARTRKDISVGFQNSYIEKSFNKGGSGKINIGNCRIQIEGTDVFNKAINTNTEFTCIREEWSVDNMEHKFDITISRAPHLFDRSIINNGEYTAIFDTDETDHNI